MPEIAFLIAEDLWKRSLSKELPSPKVHHPAVNSPHSGSDRK